MNTIFNILYKTIYSNIVNFLLFLKRKENLAILHFAIVITYNQAQITTIDTTEAGESLKLAYTLQAQAKHDSAFYYFEKASKLYKSHKIWNRYIKSLNGQGFTASKLGKQKVGLDLLQEAIKTASLHLENESDVTAKSYYYIGAINEKSGQYQSAIKQYQKAIEIHNNQLPIDLLEIARIHNYIGVCYLYSGQHKKALIYHQKALHTRIEYLGDNNNDVAHCYNSIGVVYDELSQYDKAEYYYQKALEIRLNLFGENHKDVAQSYYNIGGLQANSGQLNSALSYVQKALSIFKKALGECHTNVGAVNNNLGNIYLRLGNYKLSIQHQQIALEILTDQLGIDHPHLTYPYKSIGTAYTLLGRYNLALKNYQKALDIEINRFPKEHPSLRMTYTGMGDVYNFLGQYHKALDYYQKGLHIHIKHFGLENPETVNPYINIGVVYKKLGDYDTALEYYQKALKIGLRTWGEHHLDVADPYQNMSIIYHERKQFDLASDYLQKALKIRKDLLGEDHPKLAELYSNMGDVNQESEQYDQSLKHYLLALRVLRKSVNSHHPDIARLYNSLGNLYYRQHNYKQALDYYQKAIINNVPDFTEIEITANPEPKGYLNGLVLLESLQRKAEIVKQLKSISNDPCYKDLLRETYLHCDALIDQLRHAAFNESDKMLLGEISTEIYQNAIVATGAIQKKQATSDSTSLHTAFYFSEKNKAMILSEALHENSAKRFAQIPDSMLTREKRLKEEYAFIYRKLTDKLDTLKKEEYQDHLFQINKDQEALISHLEQHYPDYYKLKYDTGTVNIPQLRRAINENSALISYVLGHETLYIFTITKDSTDMQQFPLPDDFDDTLQQLLQLLNTYPDQKNAKVDYQNYTQTAHQIYNWILQKSLVQLDPQIDTLIIIPEGKLNYLSFDALLTDLSKKVNPSNDYSKLSYLTKKYKISYAVSATLWYEASNASTNNRSNSASNIFGGFAPEYKEQVVQDSIVPKLVTKLIRDGEMPLPGAKEEVQQIARIIGGDAWIGASANENMFKQNASRYQILHLAMHALLDDNEPMNSSFVLTASPHSVEDGFLYASELYAMSISADLAVLSACDSGGGSLKKGEGLMSLSRAFMYVGCPAQVMSLWKVSDLASKQIMIDFYKGLKDKKTIDMALRDAKLTYLEQIGHPNYSHPFFWSSFVSIGNMEKIDITPKQNMGWWYWIIIGIGILLYIWFTTKKHASGSKK